MTTKNVYRNKPQFETKPTLNKNITPNIPKFYSNAMDNQGLVPLNNCSNGCCCGNEKAHKEGHKHEGCHCDHK